MIDMTDVKGGRPELIGTAMLDTIGIVISSVDSRLLEVSGLTSEYRALGFYSSRTGASGQMTAMDEALKMTNCDILSIELPRDTKGWGGHGVYMVIGAKDVADVREAIRIALDLLPHYAGGLYINQAGHVEMCYTASAGKVLAKGLSAEIGKAFGFMAGSPASIGALMADTAVKSGDVDIVDYMTPNHKASLTNEVILCISGDAQAVSESLNAARAIGLEMLGAMGDKPECQGNPYF